MFTPLGIIPLYFIFEKLNTPQNNLRGIRSLQGFSHNPAIWACNVEYLTKLPLLKIISRTFSHLEQPQFTQDFYDLFSFERILQCI